MKYILYCRKSTESEDRQIMSLDSQRAELERAFGAQPDVEIVEIVVEAKSAMTPGRPFFNRMLARIEAGEADGIIAWAPDRLARNSIDGGRLVYMLDRRVLRDLKFSTYTFENNSQGKFMLAIMFGQSKYYSDALSENVHRGIRSKLASGWRPASPPLGYMTDPKTREVVPDPDAFLLVQKMFLLILAGSTAREVATIARDQWQLRMPRNRRSMGDVIALPTVYRILSNPFYAGRYMWKGELHFGKHQPMITWPQFRMVREKVGRPGLQKPQKHSFAFTGLIRCGGCGLMITAEARTKPSGRRYVYYHCTKRALVRRCSQRAVREADLEAQLLSFLASLAIPEEVERSVLAALAAQRDDEAALHASQAASLKQSRSMLEGQSAELVQLKIRGLIDEATFIRERDRIEAERLLAEQADVNHPTYLERFELAQEAISFSKQAVSAFQSATPIEKRKIIQKVGSNPVLLDGKLSIQAVKPFNLRGEMPPIL